MDTIEQLEQRKKELELRREIARLEEEERLTQPFNRKHLYWLVPLTLASMFTFIVGADNDNPAPQMFAGVFMLIPAAYFMLRYRRRR